MNGKRDIDGKKSSLSYKDIAYLICRGGWTMTLTMDRTSALEVAKNYIDVLCDSDISKVDGVKRDPNLARLILKSYARQTSTIDTDISLCEDIKANNVDISDRTILDYISVLEKAYVVEEIGAWNPNIRSKTAVRSAPKKTFIDPSLAVASLGCSLKELMLDVRTLGLLFENLVDRDLSVYARKNGGTLRHYRDRYGLECDQVIHFEDGRYALIETKLSASKIKEAEEHLLTLQKLLLESDEMKEKPSLLMIVTGTDLVYITEKGVLVVPIGCLKD